MLDSAFSQHFPLRTRLWGGNTLLCVLFYSLFIASPPPFLTGLPFSANRPGTSADAQADASLACDALRSLAVLFAGPLPASSSGPTDAVNALAERAAAGAGMLGPVELSGALSRPPARPHAH